MFCVHFFCRRLPLLLHQEPLLLFLLLSRRVRTTGVQIHRHPDSPTASNFDGASLHILSLPTSNVFDLFLFYYPFIKKNYLCILFYKYATN
ncbi:uncharacterized protein DS421_3g65040 [Arachis hypogaea]|nr:uncharacterized protein DS421_3g65040 [Arachis hypogaea]